MMICNKCNIEIGENDDVMNDLVNNVYYCSNCFKVTKVVDRDEVIQEKLHELSGLSCKYFTASELGYLINNYPDFEYKNDNSERAAEVMYIYEKVMNRKKYSV